MSTDETRKTLDERIHSTHETGTGKTDSELLTSALHVLN